MPRLFYKSTFAPDTPPLPNPAAVVQGWDAVYPVTIRGAARPNLGTTSLDMGGSAMVAPFVAHVMAQAGRPFRPQVSSPSDLTPILPSPWGWNASMPQPALAVRRPQVLPVDLNYYLPTPPAFFEWVVTLNRTAARTGRPFAGDVVAPVLAPLSTSPQGWDAVYPSTVRRSAIMPTPTDLNASAQFVPMPTGWNTVYPVTVTSPRRPMPDASILSMASMATPQGWGAVYPSVPRRPVPQVIPADFLGPMPPLPNPTGWSAVYPVTVATTRRTMPDLATVAGDPAPTPQGWDASATPRPVRMPIPQWIPTHSRVQASDAVPQGWAALYPVALAPIRRAMGATFATPDFYFRATPLVHGAVTGTWVLKNRVTGVLTLAPLGALTPDAVPAPVPSPCDLTNLDGGSA